MTKHNDVDAARIALSRQPPDYAAAYDLLTKSAMVGSSEAQYALGTWYLHGTFVDQDLELAIKYLRSAADQNYPDALFDLAVCYENGTGVACDLRAAYELYLRGALRGERQCLYEVGRCVYHGIGVHRDEHAAKIWIDEFGRRKQSGS